MLPKKKNKPEEVGEGEEGIGGRGGKREVKEGEGETGEGGEVGKKKRDLIETKTTARERLKPTIVDYYIILLPISYRCCCEPY